MPKYKYGKIERTINLDTLGKLMKRVEVIDRRGYGVEFYQALIALFYWSGFRESEILGGLPHKLTTKKGVKLTEGFPPLLKEQMWVDNEFLYVKQVARKHGHREGPIAIPLDLPYVCLIVEQWKKAITGQAVFPISHMTAYRILKRLDPKLYWHFFILNRLTKQAEDPRISQKDQEDWSGKSPQTLAYYRALSGRDVKHVGTYMRNET